MVIKLAKGAMLLGTRLGWRDLDSLQAKTRSGKARTLTLRSLIGSRGGRGSWVVKRGGFTEVVTPPVETPEL